MNLTCETCHHLFEVSEGVAALGDVTCPKCNKPVAVGGPKEGAVDLAGGNFDDFFEVEQTQIGGFDASKSASDPTSPAQEAEPSESSSSPETPALKTGKGTDDALIADFGDFDTLFEDAGKAKTVIAPAPAGEPPAASSPSAPTVEDLLADFKLDDEPAPPPPAVAPAPPPPQASPPSSPPASAPASDDLDQLFNEFVADAKPPAPKPPPAPRAAAPSKATPSAPSPSSGLSRPDEDLEDLFSEVSQVSTAAPAGEAASEEQSDVLAAGLEVEYKRRRKLKIPKALMFGAPAVILAIGLTALGMAKFTSGGFFGWKVGSKSADGYEPPSSGVLKQLNARSAAASALLNADHAEGYKKATAEFREILKVDPRHSPTDARLVEAILLYGGNMVDSNNRAEIEKLMGQSETYHPGIIEAVRAAGRAALGSGDLARSESQARKASALNPKDAETMVLMGEIAMARADWDFAAQQFQHAVEIANDLVRPRRLLALVKIQQGKVEEAEEILRGLVAGKPPNPASEAELWRLLYSHYGKVPEAKQGLEEMIKNKANLLSNTELGKAWRYLSEISEAGNDIPAAIHALERATSFDPLNHVNSFKLGKLYLDRKEYEKGAEQFGRAAGLSPQTPEYSIYRGWALRELGKSDDALSDLSKGLERSPGNVLGLYQLGLTQRDLGRIDDAVASLETALKNEPRHVDSMTVLGELYLKKDNFTMATMHLRSALAIAPKSAKAHNALGEVFLAMGKPQEALAELKLAEAVEPQNVVVLADIGKAYLALKRVDKASEYFQSALALDSTRMDTQVALGELQHKKKEYTKSLETYRRVLELRPKDFDTRVKLAEVLIEQESYQEAVNELLEAAKYNPDYYLTRLNLGIAWRGVGNLDSSLEELNKATRIRPEAAGGYYHTEVTQIYRNDPAAAEKSMEKAVSLDPKYPDPLIALGEFYDSRNIYSKAAEYYARAEKMEPRNTNVLLKMAEAYRKDDKSALARKYYERTLKSDRKNVDALVGLGQLLDEEQQPMKAGRYYELARSVDAQDPRPHYFLGFIYKNMGKKSAALLAFRKYLKLDPQSKEKEDIEAEIAALTR